MDIATITQLISGVGFPIAMCMMMGWYIMSINKQNTNDIKALETAINNNTLVIQKLADKMEEWQ